MERKENSGYMKGFIPFCDIRVPPASLDAQPGYRLFFSGRKVHQVLNTGFCLFPFS